MNPFSLRSMIKDPGQFTGRGNELHDLYTLLTTLQSCAVVGPRRIGKSSLLYHLAQPEIYQTELPEAESYVFGFIDLQELMGLEIDDFFFTTVERFAMADPSLDVDMEKDTTASGFRRFLSRTTQEGKRLVLCCDAFEMLSQNPRFEVDFFTYLRGLCSNYNLALVTSSRDSLYELCHQGNLQTSQFWNIFVERSLSLLTEKEAWGLVEQGFALSDISVTEEAIAFAIRLAGPHPFFLQVACYHLYEDLIAYNDFDEERIQTAFIDEVFPHFKHIWTQLTDEEQSALIALSHDHPLSADSSRIQGPRQQAIITAEADNLSLISDGWHLFIHEQGDYSTEESARTLPEGLNPEAFQVKPLIQLPQADSVPRISTSQWNIGRYEVLEELGRGGMARVYRAFDPSFKRDVAIKVLPTEFINDEMYRARFEREAQSIATLEHPSIVPVYDFGTMNDQPFLVMRLMPGGALDTLLKHHGPLTLEQAIAIVARIATGMDEAHSYGIIHRDIKPGNILFDQYSNAYLSDFGIARISVASSKISQTSMVGTPAYMSPEQIYGDLKIDGRSDVYSLGVMFFEMVTGEAPFKGDTPSRVMMSHLMDVPPDINTYHESLPDGLNNIMQQVLTKKPVDRYASAGAFATALAGVLRQGNQL